MKLTVDNNWCDENIAQHHWLVFHLCNQILDTLVIVIIFTSDHFFLEPVVWLQIGQVWYFEELIVVQWSITTVVSWVFGLENGLDQVKIALFSDELGN